MEKKRCPQCGSDQLVETSKGFQCKKCHQNFSLEQITSTDDKPQQAEEKFSHLKTFAPTQTQSNPSPKKETKTPVKKEIKPFDVDKITGKIIKQKYQKKMTISRYRPSEFALNDGLLVNDKQKAILIRNNHSIGKFEPGKYPLNDQTLYLVGKEEKNGRYSAEIFFYNTPKPKTIQWEAYIKVKIFTGEKYESGTMRVSGDYLFNVEDLEKFITYVLSQDPIGKKGLPIKEVRQYVIPMVLVNMRDEFPKIVQRNLTAQITMKELMAKVQEEMFAYLNRSIRQYGVQISQYQIKEMSSDDIAIKGGNVKKKKKVWKFFLVLIILGILAVLAYFYLWPLVKGYLPF